MASSLRRRPARARRTAAPATGPTPATGQATAAPAIARQRPRDAILRGVRAEWRGGGRRGGGRRLSVRDDHMSAFGGAVRRCRKLHGVVGRLPGGWLPVFDDDLRRHV